MKKSNRFLLVISLFCALMLCCSTIAFSAQQVTIPYVISGDGWWTGIAITNDTGTAIDDMKISFTTNAGASGAYFSVLKTLTLEPPTIPGTINPNIPKIWTDFVTNIETIAGHSILAKTLDDFYKGTGSKILPSTTGSVTFSHTGSEKFSVTVYIGSPNGFAFQVFKSSNP